MKKTLSIVLLVLLVFLAVSCSPEHQHDYKLVPEKSIEAKCESNGFNYMQCSCGAIQSIPTAALGHDYVEDKDQYIAATCITEGRRVSVCSRCDKQSVVTLAKDINNHPYRYNKAEASKDNDYVGVYKNVGKITTYATCANDGEGVFTACTACGKTGEFTVTIPSADFLAEEKITSGHAKLNQDKNGIVPITADDVTWNTTKEATAFVAGTKNAVCPTCKKEVSVKTETTLYNVEIPATKDTTGFWTYSDRESDEDDTYNEYYMTVSSKNGFVTYELYKLAYTKGAAKLTTTSVRSDDTTKVAWQDKVTGEVAWKNSTPLKLTFGSDVLYLTQYTEDADPDTKTGLRPYEAGDYAVGSEGTAYTKIAAPTEHEHDFKVMSDRRAVGEDESDKKGHYLACDCGLSYVFEEHANDCPTCGYSSTSWFKVTVTFDDNSADDKYYLKKGSSVTLADGTPATTSYTNFFGATKGYTAISSKNGEDQTKSKAPVYYCATETGILAFGLTART